MSTQEISYTVPSDGWTGTVDVTNANLDTDVSITDFAVFYNDTEQGSTELANWTKTSATQLTYSGSSLNTDDVVVIHRDTPTSRVQSVAPQTIILSSLWNAEFDRLTRWQEERDEFFSGAASTTTVSDTAYSSGWNGVTNQAPTKNAVYDMMNGTNSFSGTLTFTGSIDADSASNVYVPTRARVDAGGEATTNAASQAWVYTNLPYTFDARLSISSSDPIGRGSGSTIYLHPYSGNCITLYDSVNTRWEPYFLSGTVSLAVGTMTADLPYDIFVYDSSGTVTLEKVAWTSATTRATALTKQNGVYVKTGDTTKRYVGTIFSKGSNTVEVSAASSDVTYSGGYVTTICYCGITNYYNSFRIPIEKYDSDTTLQNSSAPFNTTAWTANTQLIYDNQNYSKFACAGTGLGDNLVKLSLSASVSRASSTAFIFGGWYNQWTDVTAKETSYFGGNLTSAVYASGASYFHCTVEKPNPGGYNTYMIQGVSSISASNYFIDRANLVMQPTY